MNTFLQNFTSVEDIENAYKCTVPGSADIRIAWYGDGDYSGSSFVLYRLDGKLYEVNGSHCSCYGLEDQWEPMETSVPALRMRTFSDWYEGAEEARQTLAKALDQLETEGGQ